MTSNFPGYPQGPVDPPSPAPTPTSRTGLIAFLAIGSVLLLLIVILLAVVLTRPAKVVDAGGSGTSTTSSTSTSTSSSTSTSAPVVTITASLPPVTPPPTDPTPTATPPPTEPPAPVRQGLDLNSLSVDGLAPLTLGMTIAEAQARTGLTTERAQCGSGSLLVGTPQGLTVRFVDGRLWSIFVNDPSVRTLSGVGVGTSVDELQRKLPRLVEKPSDYQQLTLYVFRSADGARELVFWVGDGAVTSMTATYGTNGEHEEC